MRPACKVGYLRPFARCVCVDDVRREWRAVRMSRDADGAWCRWEGLRRLPDETDVQAKVSEGTPVNLQSYVETEFATFGEKPFNELDAALFTQLAMVRVELAAFVQGGYELREDGVLVDASGSDELAFSLRDLLCAECFDQMFTGLVANQVRACFLAAAMSPRYRAVRVARYQSVFDADRAAQFSATTFACDEFAFVAFRGTDASLVGWREDFNLALESPVPSQALGLAFAMEQLGREAKRACQAAQAAATKTAQTARDERTRKRALPWKRLIARLTARHAAVDDARARASAAASVSVTSADVADGVCEGAAGDPRRAGVRRPFYLGGHSKGGNIVEYVMLSVPDEARSRITAAYSFDGPGFMESAFDAAEFAAASLKLRKLMPQDSIIGTILYSKVSFEVVQSSELGFRQHDLFSWEVAGDAFVRRAGLTAASQVFDAATNQWLRSYSEQEKREFVTALFDSAEASGALDVNMLFGGGVQSVQYLRAAAARAEEHADVLRRFAADLADALGSSAANHAGDALRAAREQMVGQMEGAWQAIRGTFPGQGDIDASGALASDGGEDSGPAEEGADADSRALACTPVSDGAGDAGITGDSADDSAGDGTSSRVGVRSAATAVSSALSDQIDRE